MFQKWFLLKCPKFFVVLSSLSLFGSQVQAAPLKKKAHSLSSAAVSRAKSVALPSLLKEVEAKYAASPTVRAEFTQLNENPNMSDKKKKSSGKIFVKRPSRIRWEVTSPNPSLLISDGKKYWFYTPPFDEGERGQLIEKSASIIQSKLADALLAGSFSTHQFRKIEENKSPHAFLLEPKPGTAGTVERAYIEIDPENKLIKKVILEHKGGNRSEITLSHVEIGPSLEESLFVFSPPENTDIVKGDES